MRQANRLLLAWFVLSMGAAHAEVQEVKDGYFTIQSVILVDANPPAAWKSLVRLQDWWDSAHTWSGAARNLSLDPRAGGCFCEKLKGGGSVQHARVVFAQPGQLLRLEGGLGPLQEMPVSGVLTFTLAPDGPGTRITLNYKVAGVLSLEAAKLAPLVDQVMSGQFERLRAHINSKDAGTKAR
jgi:uncharacterized protein YndB with AHSA1/START domain